MQAAYDLRLEVKRVGKWEIEVLYSIDDTRTHRDSMPSEAKSSPDAKTSPEPVSIHLAYAPTNPRDFSALAVSIAKSIKQGAVTGSPAPVKGNTDATPG